LAHLGEEARLPEAYSDPLLYLDRVRKLYTQSPLSPPFARP
jgi:hypothetical protein